MPARSAVATLPADVRAELDRRLVERAFGGYEDLAGWLVSQGYAISKSALHRYGSALEEDFERTMADVARTQRMAQAFAEANPDQATALTDATVRVAQESLLRITLALRKGEDDPAALAKLMPNVTRALADLGRLNISREKWSAERERQIARAAAEGLAQSADAAGEPVTAERIRALVAEVYGV